MNATHEIVRDGGFLPLTVAVPFTRAWAVQPFFDALEASDVPRSRARLIAYVDSDDDALVESVRERMDGWGGATLHVSGWPPPEENAIACRRRKRHCAMRLAMRALLPKSGTVLLLEDDTLVPPFVYSSLMSGFTGKEMVTGVQVGRWGVTRCTGLWRARKRGDGRTVLTAPHTGIGREHVDGCGLYCLLADASVYRSLDFRTWSDDAGQDVSVTLRHKGPIVVDWSVGCGHMTEKRVILPEEATPYERTVSMITINTPSGPFWAATARKEEAPMNGFYRVKQRIVSDGAVEVKDGGKMRAVPRGRVALGKGTDIPIADAVEYARRGLINDPVLAAYIAPVTVAHVDEVPVEAPEFQVAQFEAAVAPVEEVKAEEPDWMFPDEHGMYTCRVCGKTYKTEKGIVDHMAKHA